MNESERDLNDSTTHKLKKAVRLSKKLQEKIEFEREVISFSSSSSFVYLSFLF